MRFIRQGHFKTTNGLVVDSGTVSVFLAGTATPASIYVASSGGVAVNSVLSSADGSFSFYVDDKDYSLNQRFKMTFAKPALLPHTYDDEVIFPPVPQGIYYADYNAVDQGASTNAYSVKSLITLAGSNNVTVILRNNSSSATTSYTVGTDLTVPANVLIQHELGAMWSGGGGKKLTINSDTSKYPNAQVFSGFAAGDILLGSNADIVLAALWGASPSASATVNLLAIQCAFGSKTYGNKVRLGRGIFDVNPTVANPLVIAYSGSFLEGVASSTHSANAGTTLHNTSTGDCIYINAGFRGGIRHMQVTGNINSRYGINYNGTLYPELEDVVIGEYSGNSGLGHGSHGLRLNGAVYYGSIHRVVSRGNYGKGLMIEGGSNFNAFKDCQFQGNLLDGAHIKDSYSNSLRDCDISTNGGGSLGFEKYGSITSSSVANPSVIGSAGHGRSNGDTIMIGGHTGSTPDINGTAYIVSNVTADTFTIPVNVTVGGTGGIWTGTGGRGLLISGDTNGSITSSSIANPTVITTPVAHGLSNSDTISILGHAGSTPAISGSYVISNVTTNTFTIPVNVTVGGTAGTWSKITAANAYTVGTILDNINYEVNGYGQEIYQNVIAAADTEFRNFTGDNMHFHLNQGNGNYIDNPKGSSLKVTLESQVDHSELHVLQGAAYITYVDNGAGGSNIVTGSQTINSVASQAALPIPSLGKEIRVTGNVDITSVTMTAKGMRTVMLTFSDILTIHHGNNIKLAGGANFTTASGSNIVMYWDTSNLIELSRKA